MRKFKLIPLILLFAVLISCAGNTGKQTYKSANANAGNIAVLPLKSSYPDMDLSVLSEYFYSAVRNRLAPGTVIGSEVLKEKIGDIRADNPGISPGELNSRLLKDLNADSYVTGFVKYFRQREGSELGVRSPASVVFIMQLADSGTNSLIWSYEFDETQLPLLSDLTNIKKFFERNGKWITGEQLLKEGINQGARQLSDYLEVNN